MHKLQPYVTLGAIAGGVAALVQAGLLAIPLGAIAGATSAAIYAAFKKR
jgi:hypothetical protein